MPEKMGEQDAPGVTFESNSLQERCSAPNAGARVPLNSLNRENIQKSGEQKKSVRVTRAVHAPWVPMIGPPLSN
jgi:hypothetical protein